MNKLQNVYFDDVFAFVHDKNEYLQMELYVKIGDNFFNIETLDMFDADIRNFYSYDGLGVKGDVYQNGSRTGIITALTKTYPGRMDYGSYWLPVLNKSTYPIVQGKYLSNFKKVVTIGELLKYQEEYNNKLMQEYFNKGDGSLLNDAQTNKTVNSIRSFYSAVQRFRQKGEE